MALTAGSRVGPYQILSAIGAGGMGEVYRARDAKLGRDVAIKVLPEAFARDAERMARFEREAKVLASLNHPNIAAIYGLEDSGSARALVMELAEGPTLADSIRQGPLSIDDTLRIARQIADALEYAHEHGIIHRDLKPANVKVAADDAVKILDFGLAKALGAGAVPAESANLDGLLRRMENLLEGETAPLDIANSPTISQMATQAGVLLGTAAYMSPEQAKGKPVDRRADIWAFGCVLYEMLTGKMAFHGESVTDTLAAVIRAEPDWSQLPAATPMRVRVLLQRCLQKDPKQRLRDIGDARISLDEVLSGAPEAAPGISTARENLLGRRGLILALGTLLIGAAVATAAMWYLKPSPAPPPKPVTRFTITLPPGQRLVGSPALALSSDGSKLAYTAATQGGAPQIYLRAMDSGETRPIPGSEGANQPFFSPDGQWIGFFADGELRKISVNGTSAESLTDARRSGGASWGVNNEIIFSSLGLGLQQVSDVGGSAKRLAPQKTAANIIWGPEVLPANKAVIFSTGGEETIAVQLIATGERRSLIRGGISPRYLPSGHLIYVRRGALMAVPFDASRLAVTGNAVPIVQGVMGSNEGYQYSISSTGSLAYVPGGLGASQNRLVWVSRNGAEQPLSAPARNYLYPRLSPDGRRIALDLSDDSSSLVNRQVWLYDLARDTLTRFTFEGTFNGFPLWMPDGRRITFVSSKDGINNIFWQMADGSSGPEELAPSTPGMIPTSWSASGRVLSLMDNSPEHTGIELLQLSDTASGSRHDLKPQPFLESPYYAGAPQFSPDGRWLAYVSDESGRWEIYVQSYPGPGGKWQISTDGGSEPVWDRNGRELFYRNGDKMMVVDITTQPSFSAGKPKQLFEKPYMQLGGTMPTYDVSPDGQRFLMLKSVEQEATAPTQINVVLNWTEELKRLVPTGNK